MKNMRNLGLAATALLCSATVSAHDFEVDGIYYNITSEEGLTVEVTYQGSTSSEYSDEYNGKVAVPESVTYNGNTYTVTCIGESAFRYCTGLIGVTIPNSVTSIELSAFSSCSGLTDIIIPNSVTSMGKNVFGSCSSLTEITIPESVTSIEMRAFHLCSGLTKVTIPESVAGIGRQAFSGCSSLKSITIPNAVTSIESETFEGCSSLTNITIPNAVTSIGNEAFYECSNLTSVTIGNSVTSIGQNAFYKCSGLTSVHITDLEAWCKIVFNGSSSNPFCYANHLYLNGEEITDLVVPESVTSIGEYAFCGCSSLSSVTISNSVTSIGMCAFTNCSGLESITIGNSVASIGELAFSNCSGLESVTIGSSVTSIGYDVFFKCSNMTELICNATTPPSCDVMALNGINKETCMLKVPQGCVEAYQAADQWKDFYNIEEYATSIDEILFDETTIADIYTIDGRLYMKNADVRGMNLPHGLYIINGRKVVVK